MLGWCIDANDLEDRLKKDYKSLHNACRNGILSSKGVLECNCWCHTTGVKPVKRPPVKRKKAYVQPEETNSNPVPKKRGRPKGSKNKPKPVPIK